MRFYSFTWYGGAYSLDLTDLPDYKVTYGSIHSDFFTYSVYANNTLIGRQVFNHEKIDSFVSPYHTSQYLDFREAAKKWLALVIRK